MTETFNSIKHIVTYVSQKFNLFPRATKESQPLVIKEEDALTFALYKHKRTQVPIIRRE